MLIVRLSYGSNEGPAERALAKVVVDNVSAGSPLSDYLVAARDNRGLDTVFHLTAHRRDSGAWELTRRIATAIVNEELTTVPDGLDLRAHVLAAELKSRP